MFFFEKKNQKTFAFLCRCVGTVGARRARLEKVFLLLFLQKKKNPAAWPA
jgi:hypothetical protein